MIFRFLADSVLLLHLGFVLFAVGGAIMVLRRPGLAALHLPAVAWGIIVQYTGWICPLTPLENHFRVLGGQAGYAGGFVEHYLLVVLYPEGLTREIQLALGTMLLALNVGAYAYVLTRGKTERAVTVTALLIPLLLACSASDSPSPSTAGGGVESISLEPEPAGPPPSFADFPLYEPPSPSQRPPLDLGSHPDAARFRTALTDGVARGPNFAGDLTVVSWRCGTSCEEGLVVDLRSGRVVGHVEAVLGFEFRTDSRLLVLNPPSRAVVEPCPRCETSYLVWDDETGLRPLPETAWRGIVPIPVGSRALVARTRTDEASGALDASAGGAVRTAWNRLVIVAEDGTSHLFEDDLAAGELEAVHQLLPPPPGLPAHVVRRILIPEGVEHILVSRATGRRTVVDAPPVGSPDGRRFVTASLDLITGHAPNRVRVYRADGDGFEMEWELSPHDWGARDPAWENGDRIRLDRGVVDWSSHGLFTSPMTISHRGGRWEIEPSSDHARDVLLAFFAALSTGRTYPEAARFFGGSYEVLHTWNPDIPATEQAALWQAACEHNGLQCLRDVEVFSTTAAGHDRYVFEVGFRTETGEEFVLGPCCGATPEEMPPVRRFEFTVRRVGYAYRVETLPVYVP